MDIAFHVQQNILQNFYSSRKKSPQRPFLVALCGIPGSGKSTIAEQVSRLCKDAGLRTKTLPMDGYHVPLARLPKSRIYERGAKDTFDLERFRSDMAKLAFSEESTSPFTITFPDFDHAIGDPVENAHELKIGGDDGVQVVIVEGLYVLADEVVDLFDFKLYIDSDVEKCISGLKLRNLVIPGYSPEELLKRCDIVDRSNALFVESLRRNAQAFVPGFNI